MCNFILPQIASTKVTGEKTVVIHRTYKSRSRLINPLKSNTFLVAPHTLLHKFIVREKFKFEFLPALMIQSYISHKIYSLLCYFWQV